MIKKKAASRTRLRVNMAITKHDDGFFAKIIHYKYTTFIFYNE